MPTRADFPYLVPVTLRWKDNDVYGHVNNVDYYSFFDTAINMFLVLEGGLDVHCGQSIGLCAESTCNYHAPLTYPGAVEVGVRVEHLGSSSVRYGVAVFAQEVEEPAATGTFVHVFVDRETRRPTPIGGRLREALAGLL